jgi:Rieske Fe-S protein
MGSCTPDDRDPRECEGCALRDSRRDFIGQAVAALTTVAGALALPKQLHALAMNAVSPTTVMDATVIYPLPASDGAQIDKANEMILVRWQGMIYAFALSCPHRRTALKWQADDHRFQCPKHRSKYEPDGRFIEGRATRGMDRYMVRMKGKELVVDRSKLYKEDQDRAGWLAAGLRI